MAKNKKKLEKAPATDPKNTGGRPGSNKDEGVSNSKGGRTGNGRPKDQGNKNSTPRGKTYEGKPKTGTSSGAKTYDSLQGNDISWWNNSPMFDDATRVPFNRIYGDPVANLGVSFPTVSDNDESILVSASTNENAVPGIMVINFQPTIGSTAGGANAPVNRAFTSLYGSIYSRTTGAMQFQQADIALMMTSVSSISMLIALVKRALGVSQLYAGQNYYYPVNLLKALGYDPATIIGSQDEIRMRLNNSILSFNNLKIPDFMSIYKRWYSLCHNIYADEDDVQSQLYAFRPDYVYKYEDLGGDPDEIAYLTPALVPGSRETDDPSDISETLELIDTLLNAWRNSSDLGIISGSVQRAFADSDMITLDYVNSGDTLLPVPDRNMMWQINNLTTLKFDNDVHSAGVFQNPERNYLVFEPKLLTYDDYDPQAYEQYMHFRDSTLLTTFDGQTDSEFIMEATRLIAIPGDKNTDVIGGPISRINTEVVSSWKIFFTTLDQTGKLELDYKVYHSYLMQDWGVIMDTISAPGARAGLMVDFNESIALLSRFKYAPRLYLLVPGGFEATGADVKFHVGGVTGDIYKYTTVDRQALVALNETALQSIYATNF